MVLTCFVLACAGIQSSALGDRPREFVSKSVGIRMSYPKDWTVTVDDMHKPPKDDAFRDYNKGLLFEAYGPAGNDGLKITLRKDDQNADLFKLWSGNDDPWKNAKLPHNLPTAFEFRRGPQYFTTIAGHRVSISFSMMEDNTSISSRFFTVLATGPDTKGRWFSLQGSLWQMKSLSAPMKDAELVMKREYPIFVEMLKSISFE